MGNRLNWRGQLDLGLQTTNLYAYERKMHFGHVTIGIILSNAIGLVSTIRLAWYLGSVAR